MIKVLFFKFLPKDKFTPFFEAKNALCDSGDFHFLVWRPGLFSIKPPGSSWFPFFIWYLFYFFFIFKSPHYCVYLIYSKKKIIHRSCVFPPFFRFPFMAKGEIQIGDIWTLEDYRNKGLSKKVLQLIIKDFSDRPIWFLCDSENYTSIALAKGVGFNHFAAGLRLNRFGINALGKYCINQFVS